MKSLREAEAQSNRSNIPFSRFHTFLPSYKRLQLAYSSSLHHEITDSATFPFIRRKKPPHNNVVDVLHVKFLPTILSHRRHHDSHRIDQHDTF